MDQKGLGDLCDKLIEGTRFNSISWKRVSKSLLQSRDRIEDGSTNGVVVRLSTTRDGYELTAVQC